MILPQDFPLYIKAISQKNQLLGKAKKLPSLHQWPTRVHNLLPNIMISMHLNSNGIKNFFIT